ncbi:MAG: dihydrolipoyl dehydrogenase [Pseudomonadota bacterium]
MAEETYDVVILGSGPGGYVCAIRCAQLGLKTAIVERENLGGICLNWGCIPTKAMLRSAEVFHLMERATEFGLKQSKPGFDIDAIVKRSRGIAKQLSSGVAHLMKKNKITVVMGEGRLIDKSNVAVKATDCKETVMKAKSIVLATGARARELPGLEGDGERVWTYRNALTPPHMPKKLLVVGSGAIGIEFASFYAALGTDVTVVELMDRILPVEDEEVSAFAEKAFEKRGMTLLTQAKVSKLDRAKTKVTAHIEQKGKTEARDFDTVISAVGIVPNTENVGLEALGIKTDRGHVTVDSTGQTAVSGIYAIGDITGAPWLAHKASHEGVAVAEVIAGQHPHPVDPSAIAGCTYCDPQIASIGLTEVKAKEQGYDVKVGKFPFIGNGKALALGEAEGFVKTVFDKKTGALLGAHMIGAEVTELIQGFVIGQKLETTEADLMETVFPHPTLSEMMHESVLDAFDRVIHF